MGWNPQHIVISMSGPPGSGKTTALTAIGFNNYLMGRRIFSNYHVEYPHTYIGSKEELFKMRNGLFLADELWRWLFSRRAMYKEQQDIIMDFVENIRKRGIDMIYTGHSNETIDKIVRIITGYYMRAQLVPLVVPDKKKIQRFVTGMERQNQLYDAVQKFLKKPENYGVRVISYDAYGNAINQVMFKNLSFWGNMFSTTEEVGALKEKGSKRERNGVRLEKELYLALCDYGLKDITYLIPASGTGSPYPGDIIIMNKHLIDVKGVVKSDAQNDRIDLRYRDWIEYFDSTDKFGLETWLAYFDKKWRFVSIKPDMPFIKNKSWISLSILNQYAIDLKEFSTSVIRSAALKV